MSAHDRLRWEEKHARAENDAVAAPHPSFSWIPDASGERLALDLACGRGRNTGALLRLGYSVVCVDVARTALHSVIRRFPGELGKSLHVVQADLDDWPFESEVFDLVVQTDFLDRRLFDALRNSTKTGGLVLIDTFRGSGGVAPSSGPSCSDYLLHDGELRRAFAEWEIVHYAETDDPAARAAVLARKRPALTRDSRSATRNS